MHEVLVNRLGGLNLPRKSVVRLTDRPDMTLDVYRGRKTTNQQQRKYHKWRGLSSVLLSGGHTCKCIKSVWHSTQHAPETVLLIYLFFIYYVLDMTFICTVCLSEPCGALWVSLCFSVLPWQR